MPGKFVRNVIVVSLACWSLGAIAAEPANVVRSPAQLQAVLSSSQPTPLDALTSYGKRRLVDSLRWDEKGQAAFDATILVRELSPQQLAAALAFIGAEARLPALARELAGDPIRLQAPSADVVVRFAAIERLAAEPGAHRIDAAGADGQPSRLAQRYMELFGRLSDIKVRELPPADLPVYFDAAALAAREHYGTPASGRSMPRATPRCAVCCASTAS